MRVLATISLTLLMLLAISCSRENATEPANDSSLDFNVIGSDMPSDMEAAVQELTDLSILVPDPVSPNDPMLNQAMNEEAVQGIINCATLDDPARVNFRRILAHLERQMQALRRCMVNNDDPRLPRLARGAHEAIQRGLRALENDEPRMALRYFHTANRMLNLGHSICRGRG
ncbi:hypothetical protein KKH27_13390 [bacterium]|nr:hypothetical protein [bacterium]MBU1984460.1 hypothetical protein [bacterium]